MKKLKIMVYRGYGKPIIEKEIDLKLLEEYKEFSCKDKEILVRVIAC